MYCRQHGVNMPTCVCLRQREGRGEYVCEAKSDYDCWMLKHEDIVLKNDFANELFQYKWYYIVHVLY